MQATASAPAAISIVNAIPTNLGAAVAIDATVTASVTLDPEADVVTADIEGESVDDTLIRRCLEVTTDRYGAGEGGHVRTTADVPPSVGLKTSSAAANATIMATISALDVAESIDRLEATRLGVEVAREVGVTITGAFDDASASMLGGLVITDNEADEVLTRRELEEAAVILIPEERTPTETVDTAALTAVAPISELAIEAVRDGRHESAMALNGLAVASALDIDPEPIRQAMCETMAVSPSGTGPAIAAIGSPSVIAAIAERWGPYGDILETRLRQTGVTLD